MSAIFGHLNISDTDRVFSSTVGQRVIFDAATEYINRINAELAAVTAIFIDENTSEFKRRYKLPGGGYLQRRGPDGRFAAVKAYGSWDVAFPLEDFGAQMSWNDVDRAYMTVGELDRHIQTVTLQSRNTQRFELLKAILNNTADTFTDPLQGSLTIQPLANGDSVTYPPVLGAAAEATEDHYLESTSYAYTAISDTNNPIKTIVDELEEHFGTPDGGSNIVVFINQEETPYIEDLTDFDPVTDRFVRPGQDTDIPVNLPARMPGRIVGRCSGAWIVEWRSIPAMYMIGIDADAPKPLVQRIDPADTGLGQGLILVPNVDDDQFPFHNSFWRNRFGLGAGNRLNGVVLELGTGGTYSIPSGYS